MHNTSKTSRLHRNIPQLIFQIIQAQICVLIWGRATGKTEGPMADRTVSNIYAMPRSNGFLVGTTYEQILTRTLPPLVAAWEQYGLYENKHFWVRKYAPDKLKLPKAYRHPVDPVHYIHWHNGSGIYLVSQDRPGTINGTRSQWGAGDEARFLNKKKLDEDLLPTMAGQADLFGHLPNYLSLLFCSDMPRTSKGKWLFDFRDQMDPEVIDAILMVHTKIVELYHRYKDAPKSSKGLLKRRLLDLYDYINELRKGTVYFSMASTIDNIHVLGLEAIKQFKRSLSDLDFKISILNKEMIKLEKGYYALLDDDKHGYTNFNYSHIDNIEIENIKGGLTKDCRWDNDIDKTQPLSIACDHNNAINSIVTGQLYGFDELRYLSSLFVKSPEFLPHLIRKWNDYYVYHPHRVVNYYFDPTSKKGDAMGRIPFHQEVARELRSMKWEVNMIDIGQIGDHHSRHYLWAKLLQEDDPRFPRFRFNLENCASWALSCQQAGIIKVGDMIKKDKRPEQDPDVPAEEATHLSEAGDVLMYGMMRPLLESESSFIESIYN